MVYLIQGIEISKFLTGILFADFLCSSINNFEIFKLKREKYYEKIMPQYLTM